MEDFQKFQILAGLNPGDKVKTRGGKVYEFVRLKQKKFIGIDENGQAWDIWVSSFEEVAEKVDPSQKLKEADTLKSGDPFYINKNGNALLFIFEKFESGRIIGLNPASKARHRIDKSLYAGKVEDL